MSHEHEKTSRLQTAVEVLVVLRERAERFAAALDEARNRDDDQPGDEVDTVVAADFGLRTVVRASGRIKVRLDAGPPDGPVVDVVWSSANYFWHVAEVSQEVREAAEYAALGAAERAVYDVLGRRGCDHEQCMEGVAEFQDATG